MMSRSINRWISLSSVIAAPALLLTTPPCANAAILEVRISVDGSQVLSVLDNSPPDNNPVIGIIGIGNTTTPVVIGGIGFFASISNSNAPGLATGQLSTQGLNIQNMTAASHTVSLEVS